MQKYLKDKIKAPELVFRPGPVRKMLGSNSYSYKSQLLSRYMKNYNWFDKEALKIR
jgi:hypothetical protein